MQHLIVMLGLSLSVESLAQDPDLARPPALDEARFEQLQRLLAPDHEAPWRQIPWQLDLLAAQRAAVASGKPLFVWAMDGHPLGCT